MPSGTAVSRCSEDAAKAPPLWPLPSLVLGWLSLRTWARWPQEPWLWGPGHPERRQHSHSRQKLCGGLAGISCLGQIWVLCPSLSERGPNSRELCRSSQIGAGELLETHTCRTTKERDNNSGCLS